MSIVAKDRASCRVHMNMAKEYDWRASGEPPVPPVEPSNTIMVDPRPSDRRLTRAAIVIIMLALAIVMTIFVTFNIAHYNAMENELEAKNAAAHAR